MTKKLFWQDPYLRELETTIETIKENEVTVAETIFYALCGGQESDQGMIGGYPVQEARREGKEIIYTLEEGHGLKVGGRVKMSIDWERRYKLMRLHFAAEIVLQFVWRQFPKIIEKLGAHISQEKARIDFEWPKSFAPLIPSFQEKAQNIIDSNQSIISAYSDEERQERYWKIEGFAQIPCGGTHIKRTGEVGTIRLKRTNPGKGKERLEIYVSENP